MPRENEGYEDEGYGSDPRDKTRQHGKANLHDVIEKLATARRNMGGCALTSTECGLLTRFLRMVHSELKSPIVSQRYTHLVAEMTDPTFGATEGRKVLAESIMRREPGMSRAGAEQWAAHEYGDRS